jgi:hypothetical protein
VQVLPAAFLRVLIGVEPRVVGAGQRILVGQVRPGGQVALGGGGLDADLEPAELLG